MTETTETTTVDTAVDGAQATEAVAATTQQQQTYDDGLDEFRHENGKIFGKFVDAKSGLQAYRELQKEYTKARQENKPAPEKYEFVLDDDVKEKFSIDENSKDYQTFVPLMKELNLSNEKANKLINEYARMKIAEQEGVDFDEEMNKIGGVNGPLVQGLVTFAEKTARQLRDENSVAGSIMTYVRGDRFREDIPFYSNSCQLKLATPSNDTMTIVRQALNTFNNIWREGYAYRKAGVMALDIEHGGAIQLNVFDPEDHGKLRRLMTSIDGINNQYGTRSVKLVPGLQRGEWSPNQTHINATSKTLHFYTGIIHS